MHEAAAFYTALFADLRLEAIEPLHRYYGDDFVVDESMVLARAVGTPLGIPVTTDRSSSGILHVFEVRDGLITRLNTRGSTSTRSMQQPRVDAPIAMQHRVPASDPANERCPDHL